jgi:hypothetical protein
MLSLRRDQKHHAGPHPAGRILRPAQTGQSYHSALLPLLQRLIQEGEGKFMDVVD